MKLKTESNQKTLLKNRLPPVLNALSLLAMPGSIQSRLWDAVIATARARLCHTQQGRTPAATSPQPLQRVAPCCAWNFSSQATATPDIAQHLEGRVTRVPDSGHRSLACRPDGKFAVKPKPDISGRNAWGVHNLPVDNQPLTTNRSGRPSGFQFGPEPCFKMPAARRVACPSEPNPSNR